MTVREKLEAKYGKPTTTVSTAGSVRSKLEEKYKNTPLIQPSVENNGFLRNVANIFNPFSQQNIQKGESYKSFIKKGGQDVTPEEQMAAQENFVNVGIGSQAPVLAKSLLSSGQKLLSGAVKKVEDKPLQNAIKSISKDVSFMSKKEKTSLIKSGQLSPQELLKPAVPTITNEEKRLAQKFVNELGSGTNVEKATKIHNYIQTGGSDLESYLSKNNAIFNTNQLKSTLKSELDKIYPKGVKEATKNDVINTLLSKIEKNNLLEAWKGRTKFDKSIDTLFGKEQMAASGEIKVAVRNALNNFIEGKIKDSSYKLKLKDLSDAYRVLDNVSLKALPELKLNQVSQYLNKHPLIKESLKIGGYGLVGGGILTKLLD